jgi:predicted O-methyltransferase YrrM
MEALWTSVEDYFDGALLPRDPVLDAVLDSCAAASLPPISVSPSQGWFLNLLVRLLGASRVLEIGTLGGYSTIWLARALDDRGRVVTLEVNPVHAVVARANIARAGLAQRVEVRVGAALDTLPQLQAETTEPFDLVFIDADKVNTAEYFSWALKLTRPGGLIVVDNVVREGAVVDRKRQTADLKGIRRFVKLAASGPHVSAGVTQTVGRKGYDGFAIVRVTGAHPSSTPR